MKGYGAQEFPLLASGNANGTAILEGSLTDC